MMMIVIMGISSDGLRHTEGQLNCPSSSKTRLVGTEASESLVILCVCLIWIRMTDMLMIFNPAEISCSNSHNLWNWVSSVALKH